MSSNPGIVGNPWFGCNQSICCPKIKGQEIANDKHMHLIVIKPAIK